MKTSLSFINRAKSNNCKSFDAENGILRLQDGTEILMEHRLNLLFHALLKNENNYVKRSDLMEQVWNGVLVEDQSLTKAVSDLRKLLAIHKINNVKIETAHKLGYRLILKSTSNHSGNHYHLKLIPKVMGYAVVAFVVLIILIRAARY